MLTRAEWCPPGGLRKRSLEMMNGNVNGMTIRLLGCSPGHAGTGGNVRYHGQLCKGCRCTRCRTGKPCGCGRCRLGNEISSFTVQAAAPGAISASGCFFVPLFLLQTGQVLVGLNGFGGEAVVLPPVHQRRCHRDAGAYQLLQLFGLDGQHGMAGTAQQLVGQGPAPARRCEPW